MVTCFGSSLVTSFCLPDESLAECFKRHKPSTMPTTRSENELDRELLTCLGIQKDSLAFVGTCSGLSSTCESTVFSSSLDCGSSSVCCQVSCAAWFGQVWFDNRFFFRTTYLGSDLNGKCCISKYSLKILEVHREGKLHGLSISNGKPF